MWVHLVIGLALAQEFACLTSFLGTVQLCLSQFGHVVGAQDDGSLHLGPSCVWSRDAGLRRGGTR